MNTVQTVEYHLLPPTSLDSASVRHRRFVPFELPHIDKQNLGHWIPRKLIEHVVEHTYKLNIIVDRIYLRHCLIAQLQQSYDHTVPRGVYINFQQKISASNYVQYLLGQVEVRCPLNDPLHVRLRLRILQTHARGWIRSKD